MSRRPAPAGRRWRCPPPRAGLTGLAGLGLDLSGRRAPGLLARLVEGQDPGPLLADPARLDAWLDRVVTGVWHACGTCRMGRAGDPMAVTDGAGRVHGLTGLRVCDASLFPTIPCANLALPVMMTAERVAEAMLADRT
jgi:5-(hydroxymethyl)furfural/furfural oxidase